MKPKNSQLLDELITQPKRQPSKRLFFCVLAAIALLMTLPDARAARRGQLDPTFGVGGKVQTDFAGNSDYGRSIALQPDGRIVVAGWSGVYPGANCALARLNNSGSLDTTFGNGGTIISHFRATDSFADVAIQPDGKIVAVGSAAVTGGNNGTAFLVARYNSNGTLDTAFGTNGAVITNLRGDIPSGWYFSASAQDVSLLADGKILVAGQTTTVAFGRMALLRYNSDGSLDQTYGSNGVVITEFPVGPNGVNGGVTAYALALQADGKAVLAGSYVDNGFSEFALARINVDGSLDTTFGSNGEITTPIGSGDAGALDVAVQPDGKIVAAGSFEASHHNHDFTLVRYNSDGTLDATFGTGGIAVNDLSGGSDDTITGITLQQNNRIIAVGHTGQYPTFDFAVARYTTAGALDRTFGLRGKVITDFGTNSFDVPYGVVLAPSGKIIVAGETNANSPNFDFAVSRYLNR